jgi:hypothetical protein
VTEAVTAAAAVTEDALLQAPLQNELLCRKSAAAVTATAEKTEIAVLSAGE